MLEEAFKRGGQSALQLEAREIVERSPMRENNPFLGIVVRPQSHRISSLVLHTCAATYRDFLLPSGLLDELVSVELRVNQFLPLPSAATVFQGTPRL